MDKKTIPLKLWEEIGFHRPLGGMLYNLALVIGGRILGLIFNLWLIPNFIYHQACDRPFCECKKEL